MTKGLNSMSENREEVCVEVCLTTENCSLDLGNRIQDWLNDVWMPNNQEWERVWRTGAHLEIVVERQILKYDDDFSRAPEILPKDSLRLLVRLYVNWPSKNWREWLVSRILPDLRTAFSEMTNERPVYIRRSGKA
jgi:hypothetical protein